MPSASLVRTAGGSRNVLFNDGEGIVHDDLNLAEDLTELRSLVWPLFTRIVCNSQGPMTDTGAQGLMDSQTENLQRAFTFGQGALFAVTSGTTTAIYGGILACYDSDTKPLAAAASLNTESSPLRLFYVGETTGAEKVEFTHDLNPAGTPRIDMVSVKFDVVDDEALPRDFKDGTTGALTTTSPNKRSVIQATFVMRQGVDPTTPGSLPSDEHLLYSVSMPASSGVLTSGAMRDWTYPLGRRSLQLSVPANSYTVETTGDWTPTGLAYVKASGGGKTVYLWPPGSSDPCSRLLSVRIQYKFAAGGATVGLAQAALTDAAVPNTIMDLTSNFTLDNTVRTAVIDLSGDLRVDSPVPTVAPIWMSGEYRRRAAESLSGGAPQGLALKIFSSATNDAIYSVQWIVAEGG